MRRWCFMTDSPSRSPVVGDAPVHCKFNKWTLLRKTRTSAIAASTLAMVVAASPGWARSLEEIIVTAQKVEPNDHENSQFKQKSDPWEFPQTKTEFVAVMDQRHVGQMNQHIKKPMRQDSNAERDAPSPAFHLPENRQHKGSQDDVGRQGV